MSTHALHIRHERSFDANRFVYPVLSRRAGGLSIGVNLNPDKVCNFDCIYCQVDRTVQSETRFVEMDALLTELDEMLEFVACGRIWQTQKFRHAPTALRRLTDVAFSGDGEPTTYQNFDEIIAACAQLASGRREPAKTQNEFVSTSSMGSPKLVLITNASMFHRPHVRRGLAILDDNNGEIWAKLEAGTEAYFKKIDRTPISFQRILDNITAAACVRPIVIQALFMRVQGTPPSEAELDAFCDRLCEITDAGGQLKLVQVYTIARRPAESCVTPLADAEVDAITDRVCRRTGLRAAAFYGTAAT